MRGKRAIAETPHLHRPSPSQGCRSPHRRELAQLFALLALPPVRLGLARVSAPWPRAAPADVRACLDRFPHERVDVAARPRTMPCISSRSPRGTAIPQAWPAIGYGGPPDIGMSVVTGTRFRRSRGGRHRVRLERDRCCATRCRCHARSRRRDHRQLAQAAALQRRSSPTPACASSCLKKGRSRSSRDFPHARVGGRIRSSTRNRRRERRRTRPSTSCRGAAWVAAPP